MNPYWLVSIISIITILVLIIIFFIWHLLSLKFGSKSTLQHFENLANKIEERARISDERQLSTLNLLQNSLQTHIYKYGENLSNRVEKLIQKTDQQLTSISGQVEKRLSEGFEKTTATFTNVIKRLALIDEAQKKITELSTNVVSLQQVLSDKRSRGAFGEVQLSALIRNMLPEPHFSFQYTLSNNKRADCILFLPQPTGNVVIDAKFPLENYHRMLDHTLSKHEQKSMQSQFRQDIKKHIKSIEEKYIIPGETSELAVMFIPAEAVFSEIHSHFSDLVEISHKAKVFMVSPSTMMAIINTVRAVIKDEATRKQVHIIRDHLIKLAKDFVKFQDRMNKLTTHIRQAHEDVDAVNQRAQKITSKFNQLEQAQIED